MSEKPKDGPEERRDYLRVSDQLYDSGGDTGGGSTQTEKDIAGGNDGAEDKTYRPCTNGVDG
jgi:hypothetical protein